MSLQVLRKSTALARWVLLWWCMALGVAVAAPWMQPVQHTLVCSASGSITLQDTGAPDTPVGHHLDCVLCLAAGAPPVCISARPVASAAPLLGARQAPALPPHSLSAAPPPGRGPPPV
ncbi:MAG: hypothetical protein EBQ71_20255 [Betaproteobacteria bacterium]|nr:hypothetical protein [Betaproteobacteria bacterium]